MKDSDAEVRVEAAIGIGNLGPDGAAGVTDVLAELERSTPESKPLLIEALGRIGPQASAAVPAMVAELREDDGSLAMHTVEALGRIGVESKAALPALIDGLDAASTMNEIHMNLAVIRALGQIGPAAPEQTSQALIRALPRASIDERPELLQSLADLGPASDEVATALIAHMQGQSVDVVQAAAKALAQCGHGSALSLPAIMEVLHGRVPLENAAPLINSLPGYGAAAKMAVPVLIAGLEVSSGWGIDSRAAAVRALPAIDPRSQAACEALGKQLQNSLWPDEVRFAAAKGLAVYAPHVPDAVHALQKAAADYNGAIHEAAEDALKKAGVTPSDPRP
jgi:hypothetical protein